MIKSRIVSVKQSPLNEKQWCCQLDCGHDQWVTRKRRPTAAGMQCDRCTERLKEIRRAG